MRHSILLLVAMLSLSLVSYRGEITSRALRFASTSFTFSPQIFERRTDRPHRKWREIPKDDIALFIRSIREVFPNNIGARRLSRLCAFYDAVQNAHSAIFHGSFSLVSLSREGAYPTLIALLTVSRLTPDASAALTKSGTV